jgi:UDP-N-acetylmuramate: L-alanyl-gamma-D-glutamyl-meso-diaminopimelate ligase
MSNLAGALAVLKVLGHDEYKSLQILRNFSGASNRLEKIHNDNKLVMLKDFAHSPSKLRSTIQAVKELYPSRHIINCFELHTYSSLNKEFIQEYKNSFSRGDINVIFLHDHTLEIKKMEYLDNDTIRNGFMNNDLIIFRKKEELIDFLIDKISENTVLLMMSSGNFGGLDYVQLKKSLQLKL